MLVVQAVSSQHSPPATVRAARCPTTPPRSMLAGSSTLELRRRMSERCQREPTADQQGAWHRHSGTEGRAEELQGEAAPDHQPVVFSCEQWNRDGRLEDCLNSAENLLDQGGATGDFLQSSGKASLAGLQYYPWGFQESKELCLSLLSQCPCPPSIMEG